MSTTNSKASMRDRSDPAAFLCAACRQPLTSDDLGDFGLRPPRHGENPDEYCDEELLDPRDLRHLRCLDVPVDDAG